MTFGFTVALPANVVHGQELISGDKGSFKPGTAKRPPAVPDRKAIPIDNELRQRARDTIDRFSTHAYPVFRSNAIEAASNTLGADGARAIVIRGLSDENPGVRFAACIATGDLRYADAAPVLEKLAWDPDASVRLASRYALHKLGDHRLSQQMLLGLQDDRVPVRANTVLLLGMLGEKSAVTPLRRVIRDPSTSVRLQTYEALWKLGDKSVVDDMVILTLSKFPDEQIVAVLALGQSRDTSLGKHVYGLLVDEYPEVELAAARALGMLGSDEGLGVAIKYADSKESRQRGLAALAMGDIGRSDSQPALAKLLIDPEPSVQLAAATAVLKLRN
jgi:HEAT repeat protein